MNSYQLDDKVMDQDFLKGMPVSCKAVVLHTDVKKNNLKAGDRIVVLLSNRAKYMGIIRSVRFETKEKFAECLLEIVRYKVMISSFFVAGHRFRKLGLSMA
jgi:hypothetical protein